MNISSTVKNQLKKIGSTLCLTDGDWTSVPFYAHIYPLWRKKTSAFESEYTQLGRDIKEYYLYIGPHDHDITALSEDAGVSFNGKSFVFLHRDCVEFGGETIYYTGILKRLREGEYDEYQLSS